ALGAHGQPVGVLYAPPTSPPAVRDGNPFPTAPGKFTVAIFLDEQPSARQHLALIVTCCDEALRSACGNNTDIEATSVDAPQAVRTPAISPIARLFTVGVVALIQKRGKSCPHD